MESFYGRCASTETLAELLFKEIISTIFPESWFKRLNFWHKFQVLPRGEPVEETVPEPAASGDAEDSKEDSVIYDHMGRKITSK